MEKTKKEIIVFFVLLLIFSGLSYLLIFKSNVPKPEDSSATFALVYSPFLAAIIVRLIFDGNIKKLGWKFGKIKYLFIALLVPISYGIVIYGIAWLTKVGEIKEQIRIMRTVSPTGMELIILCVLGILIRSIGAFGEEVGWRGFLTPRLYKLTNLTTTSIIIGIIWTLWHLPLMLMTGYGNDFTIQKLLFSTISLISISFMLTWLRIKSGSLWVGVFYHASHNFFIQGFFDQILVETGQNKYFLTEMGLGLCIISVIIAFIFWKIRNKLQQPEFYNID
jgi:uncharacterized protein